MKKKKIKVKATLKETVSVLTILINWAVLIMLSSKVNIFLTFILVGLTVPGLWFWCESMVKLQKLEGRRNIVIR